MSNLGTILYLFILLVLASCQAKEGASSGDLVSGHLPTTNKFTLSTPTTRTYAAGEVLTLTVTFPFDLDIDTLGGSPRLSLTVGATTRYATYVAQGDLRKITFSYTFVALENDTNGIDVNALELNGSVIEFEKNGTPTNADVSTIAAQNLSNVKVDTASPTITAFSLLNIPGMYNEGDTLTFRMTFSETVVVTGTPKFVTTFDTGGAVDVNYDSGTGSTILIFSYVIGSTVADANGYAIASPIVNGTITDTVGNSSSLDFSSYVAAAQTYSSTVHVSGQYPFIVATDFPADATYVAAQDLDFTLEFDQAVTVSGSPYLTIDIGGTSRQAQYLSGSGSELITFRYTTVPGDVDANGITVTGSIVQNAGNIVITATPAISFFADALNNVFTVPVTTGIILNAIQPQATAVARNIDTTVPTWGGPAVDNTWMIGQDLNITVSFNTNMYVTQTGGTPSIPITIGATTRQAVYLSGGNGQTSLVFRYVIVESDLDSDGTIAIGSISLNGGVIVDGVNTNTLLTLPSAGLTSTNVDGVKPVISSVTAPTNATYSQVTAYDPSTMSFLVNWSEAVNYSSTATNAAYLNMDVGGTSARLQWASGTNQAVITHRPATLATMNDSNGVALSSPMAGSATIKDQAGNTATVLTYTPPNTTSINVDTTAPTITSMTPITSDGTYNLGDDLSFSVTFSESVTTNVAGGYPRIPITIGATTRYLLPIANTTNTTHTFRYTIVASELDPDGVVVTGTIEHNGTTAYARDIGRNNATAAFSAPSTPGILVDAVIPTVVNVTKPAAATYENTNILQFTVEYSEIVYVTGTPRIQATFDSGVANFNYLSGDGTTTLTFSYTIPVSTYNLAGSASAVSTIDLNGGTILDSGGNTAPATYTSQDISTILITLPDTDLWVTSSFASQAVAGSPAVSNTGAITTEACGSGTCRIFDGDDALNVTGALNGVESVFIVFKNPATVPGADYDIFKNDITLKPDLVATAYDLTTANSTIKINGATYAGVNYDLDLAPSSTNIMQIDFTTPQNYNALVLIGAPFDGRIAEVIAVTGTLTAAQKLVIYNYLDAKY